MLDNVLAPLVAIVPENPRQRAMELIKRFGLGERMHHKPSELSSGERQRTALARALLTSPRILLADEPTGNLDRENADTVLGYLAEFARDGGAVLLVTHDPQAAQFAHQVIRIEAGRPIDLQKREVNA